MNKSKEEADLSDDYSNCTLDSLEATLKAKLGDDEEFAEIITREIKTILKDLEATPPVQSGPFSIKKSFTLSSKARNVYPTISSYEPKVAGINPFETPEPVNFYSLLSNSPHKSGFLGADGNLNPMKFWGNNTGLGKMFNGGTEPTVFEDDNPIRLIDVNREDGSDPKTPPSPYVRHYDAKKRESLYGKYDEIFTHSGSDLKLTMINSDWTINFIHIVNGHEVSSQTVAPGDPTKPIMTVIRRDQGKNSGETTYTRNTTSPETFNVDFVENSNAFTNGEQSEADLTKVADYLKKNRGAIINISGNSDNADPNGGTTNTINGVRIEGTISDVVNARVNAIQSNLLGKGVWANQINISKSTYGYTTSTSITIQKQDNINMPTKEEILAK